MENKNSEKNALELDDYVLETVNGAGNKTVTLKCNRCGFSVTCDPNNEAEHIAAIKAYYEHVTFAPH